MRFTKTVPYKLKRLVPMLGLAGATMFTACDKENEPVINPPHNNDKDTTTVVTPPRDTTTVIPPEPHYNVELFFNMIDDIDHIAIDTIKKYDANKLVDTIFMIPNDKRGVGGGVSGMPTELITSCRDLLQSRFDTSPKVRGKGDLLFGVGRALPADSLWFVQQGWTVNQSRNNQR